MSHLTELELVDLVDGCLAETRRRHVEACGVCREREADMRVVVARAVDIHVPEPSPLFWDQLAARVREQIAVEKLPAGRSRAWHAWAQRPAFGWAVAAVLVVLVTGSALWRAAPPTADSPATIPAVADTGSLDRDIDLESDEGWALVRTFAEDLEWDDASASGITAHPGSAERVALEMSSDERAALAQLIRDEVPRTGA